MNDSLQNLIMEYRLKEQEKNAKKLQENDENLDADVEDDDDDDDANLQRILKQIGVSLHNKYRQKQVSEQSSKKLSTMIQDLYQTMKKTQPHLFTKSSGKENLNDKQPSTEESSNQEETKEDDDKEEIIPLTPEMQHADNIYHQAMKLINVTINRKYES